MLQPPRNPAPSPAFYEPLYRFEAVDLPILGFSFFRATQPELRYLNREVALVRGTGNFQTGALSVETFLVRAARRNA